MDEMITVSHLIKRYHQKLAVDDITFEIQTGKITGFLGPNGAGKTTTMRLMVGLELGDGETLYDGKPLRSFSYPSRVVGILLEAKAFHPNRSARNHLAVLADAGGVPLKRVDEVLDIVGLRSEAKRPPGKFSLGMSQRLSVAAAILGEPKYLILDEPANGLDPEGIVWLREFIKQYAAKGQTVFVSSHLLGEIAQLADNIIVIGKGKLIANMPMQEFVSCNTTKGVFLRVGDQDRFEKFLQLRKVAYEHVNEGLQINQVTVDEVGKMAFEAKVPVLKLIDQPISLEEAFLRITQEAQEYVGARKERM